MKIQHSTLTIEDEKQQIYRLKCTYNAAGEIEEIVFPNDNVIPTGLRNSFISYFQTLGKNIALPNDFTLTRMDITQRNATLSTFRPRYDDENRLTHFTDGRDFSLITSEEESLLTSLKKIPAHLPNAFQEQDAHPDLPEKTVKNSLGNKPGPVRR